MWARFCPGRGRRTAPAEGPSDALTMHVELLAGLVELGDGEYPAEAHCSRTWGRTYRVQIGYAEGGVAYIAGHTDPDCVGQLEPNGTRVGGPDELGVYGLLMTAFGRQYATEFETATSDLPRASPESSLPL